MKLTLRLTLVFVLYAAALLAGVAWLAYNSGKESLRSATVSELQSTAIEKQASLNEWVDEKRMDITTLANSPATLESAAALFAASPGSAQAREAREWFVREVQPRVDGGEFLVIMILDPSSGQVMAATDPSEEGKFKENRLFFLNGRNAPYAQNVYYSIALQGPAMTASAPLLSKDGKLLGVLAGRLNLDEMNAIINRRAGLWQTDEAFLVNTSNFFVTQPRLSQDPAVLQQGVYTEAVNRCQAQASGTLSTLDYRSVPALIVYRWLPEHELCLIVKIDQAEVLAPAFAFGRKVAAISIIALLGATALGVLLSRGITRPVRVMQSAVVRFGQGEGEIRLPERGQDELGDLSREFNRMATSLSEKDARLHEYATELERKVEERTAVIKQREERYRSYIELTGQLGWSTNPEGNVQVDVPSWMNYTGQSEEEVTAWGWTKALHPDDLDHVSCGWKNAVVAGIQYEEECRIRRHDGIYRDFLARGVPIYKDDGTIQEWIGTCIDISERKQAEEALRRFELLSEHSRDIILFMRKEDGRILEANAAAIQAYGYSRQELLALSIQDLRADDANNLTIDQMAQADRGGVLFETVHLRKDGSTFPVEVSSQGAKIGNVRTLVSIVRDISERKQAEAEIASLSRFPTENPNPVLRVQNDGLITHANAASRELLEMWNCEVNAYLPPEWKELIAQTVKIGSNKILDVHCNKVLYSFMVVPVLDAGYVNLYGRDITERERAEEALRKREAEIRSLYESMTELVVLHEVVYDGNGKAIDYRIIECNPAFEKVTGIPQSQAVGALASEVYGTGEPPYLDIYAPVAETSQPVNFETEFSPLGKQFHISVFSPERGHFATLASDITDRKRSEQELHRTLEELKASNTELEQFAYVASHDLQEPLRGIAGLAQLLQQRYQSQLDSQADEYINLIVDGTQRMQTLINDLLAYSRIGRRGQSIQSTEVEAALKASKENLSVAIREYGATITNESLPLVQADATQLIQLFQNLIGNAIKFRAERPPQIHIAAADAGDFWQFSVRDNGIGIEPQYFERIFLVFQRLHTRREYKGTGIGLAICKKIVERHGGKIWVESDPEQGSTFYFTLPKGN